ncbi:hypothetical protein Pan216_54220 [Planctomycetes bacterium Pan216]|uniref:3-keto-alpha-glucoside-1,2-lyase/3-keto-2-hydroxy-glucal hydratase domain-containing protein n=1 Tax=Kolteria novifilia TaxID=2527975 RepID=A0A518BC24_9BACT|nr:hypothetical protein Pan216_54220 [Planctomycetes bacterium Pan216]
MKRRVALLALMFAPALASAANPRSETDGGPPLLPAGWNATRAGDRVMKRLVRVSAPQVKGAHDAEFVCVGDRAYIVEHDNDVQPGHGAGRRMYCVLTIVNLKTLEVEQTIPLAKSEQAFANVTLPPGACFVPRILQLDGETLRCYFASEDGNRRQAQTWYRDFDLGSRKFEESIHKVKLKTAAGLFDMQPRHLHADAAAQGFTKPEKAFGLYLFDSFKTFDGKTYVALNNFPAKQNALAVMHDDRATVEVIGHFNEPRSQALSEAAVNRLPDGTWMAICRNDKGNYHFTTSDDGVTWTEAKEMPFVPNGLNSKPTFDKFGDLYYLGWQEATQIDGCRRSVFNIDVSRDGKTWERKYRFETPESFQYPTFHQHDGVIWLTISQSDHKGSTDRIMFGKLEDAGQFEPRTPAATTAIQPENGTPKEAPLPTFAGPTPGVSREIAIPLVDLSADGQRHAVVAAGTPSTYQGHCDTVLLPDGKTMFAAWCLGHARWIGPLAKSTDAGLSWSKPLDVPKNWSETSNTPALHRLVGPDGTARLFCFADGLDWSRGGKPPYPMHQAYSEDDGETWSPMDPNGVDGEVPPKTILSFDDGKRLVMWSDLPGFVIQSESRDGGLTWSGSRRILRVPSRWSQPCVIRSPNGRKLVMLLREHSRKYHSLYSVSRDNAVSWTEPKELPAALTGDRHVAKQTPDGRLVVAFRDMAMTSPTYGHYVAWVGRVEDILDGTPGDYRVKLFHNALRDDSTKPGEGNFDCGYSDLELLPNGTIVATTYLKVAGGPEKHSVMNTRFALAETDALANAADDAPNERSAKESAQGFVALDDGKTFDGWEHKGNWEIQDGAFVRVRGGGPLTYTKALVPDDFELRFEWKVSKGCNSGVYYRPKQYEYQVLDNVHSPYGENARQSAGSLFFCMAPSKDVTKPFGQWNTGRVKCKGTVIEHWVNGERVLSFDYSDPKWAEQVELLTIRGADLDARGGRLWLQDHGQDVWFRNLRLREIPEEEAVTADPDFVPLPVTGAALQKENDRVKRMLEAQKKK